MSITNEFFVYYQGEEDYFLKIKATYTTTSNLFQLFGSFLNEFVSVFKLKNRTTENTLFYTIDIITDKKTLVTQLCSQIPDSNDEYLIREKEITDDTYPLSANDQSVIDTLIEHGDIFESVGLYYTAFSFYSLAGKNSIPYLIKMFYNLKDYQSISKYLSEVLPQYKKDPFMNEVLGYTYEWLNNKSKAIDIFSIYKDEQPIQCVAYNRLMYSSGSSKSRSQTKSLIDKDILSCMTSDNASFDFKSILNCSFFNGSPRSEKVYTYEVIKLFIERSMWKEAIEFCVKNVRFFKYNVRLLALNKECADTFVDSISNPTLRVSIARQVCSCFIYEDQIDAALKLATYLYNRSKRDIQSISLLMYVYYCMMNFDEIGRIAFDMIKHFPPDATIYDIQMGKLLEKLSLVRINLKLEIKPPKKHIFEQIESNFSFNLESANKEFDPLRMYDRFNFIIFILIYFFINHHTKEVTELLPDYYKLIRNAALCHDEAYEILNDIAQIQLNSSQGNFFSPENRKICIFGDFTSIIYSNMIFKITDKAVKHADKSDDDELTKKAKKNKKSNSPDNQKSFFDSHAGQQIWSLQPLLNQNEQGYLVQAEPFYVPEFSLWRIRDEKHGKKYVSRAFDDRLKQIKEFLINSKQDDDDPAVFAFGKRDIVKHIPNLIMKRKFASIDELENKYSSLFLSAIKRIRTFLPKKRIAIQLDYTDSKFLPFSSILYNAVSQNLPENVELTISQDEFGCFFDVKNSPFSLDNSLDALDIYSYNFYLMKSRKKTQNNKNNSYKKLYFPWVE